MVPFVRMRAGETARKGADAANSMADTSVEMLDDHPASIPPASSALQQRV